MHTHTLSLTHARAHEVATTTRHTCARKREKERRRRTEREEWYSRHRSATTTRVVRLAGGLTTKKKQNSKIAKKQKSKKAKQMGVVGDEDGDDGNGDGATCRICLVFEQDISKLSSPCACKGTLQYVHESCLFGWIDQSTATRCEAGVKLPCRLVWCTSITHFFTLRLCSYRICFI